MPHLAGSGERAVRGSCRRARTRALRSRSRTRKPMLGRVHSRSRRGPCSLSAMASRAPPRATAPSGHRRAPSPTARPCRGGPTHSRGGPSDLRNREARSTPLLTQNSIDNERPARLVLSSECSKRLSATINAGATHSPGAAQRSHASTASTRRVRRSSHPANSPGPTGGSTIIQPGPKRTRRSALFWSPAWPRPSRGVTVGLHLAGIADAAPPTT